MPHRHFVFGIPKMLRPYFYERDLLKDLCRVAHECLIEFLRTSLGLLPEQHDAAHEVADEIVERVNGIDCSLRC